MRNRVGLVASSMSAGSTNCEHVLMAALLREVKRRARRGTRNEPWPVGLCRGRSGCASRPWRIEVGSPRRNEAPEPFSTIRFESSPAQDAICSPASLAPMAAPRGCSPRVLAGCPKCEQVAAASAWSVRSRPPAGPLFAWPARGTQLASNSPGCPRHAPHRPGHLSVRLGRGPWRGGREDGASQEAVDEGAGSPRGRFDLGGGLHRLSLGRGLEHLAQWAGRRPVPSPLLPSRACRP